MPDCQFSETQFESYHARAFEAQHHSILPQFFPTRQEEGRDLGFDMQHFGGFQNFFFQYKVPYYLVRRSRYCGELQGNCFHIHVSNIEGERSRPQYQVLKQLSITEPNVLYASPLFGTNLEFARNFQNILNHTAYFNLRDAGFPVQGSEGFDTEHTIYYSNGSDFGYLYSDPTEIKRVTQLESRDIAYYEKFDTLVDSLVGRFIGIFNDLELPYNELRDIRLVPLLRKDISAFEQAVLLDLFLREELNLSWIIKPIRL